jgi:hypothetical protein
LITRQDMTSSTANSLCNFLHSPIT